MVIVGRAKYTRVHAKLLPLCHVFLKLRMHMCILPAPQSPSPKLETTRSLMKRSLTIKYFNIIMSSSGLEIMAGQQTMSGLIGELTGQPFVLPVMLSGHIRSY